MMRIPNKDDLPILGGEVFYISLAICYIYFFVGWPIAWISLVVPILVIGWNLFFIFWDVKDEKDFWLFTGRMLFLFAHFIPMALLFAWHWDYMRLGH